MKNVVFVLTRVSMWNLYEELYSLFNDDGRFNPIVFLAGEPTSHVRHGYPDAYYEKFEKTDDEITHDFPNLINLAVNKGLNYVVGYDYQSKMKKDIESLDPIFVFYNDPQEQYYLFDDWKLTSISKKFKTIYFHYGILLTNLSPELYKQDVYQAAWRLILETDQHVEEVKRQLGYLPDNFLPLGYPRFDGYLKDGTKNIDILVEKYNNTIHEKIVIFAPHWTVSPHTNRVHGKYGNFVDIKDYILKMMSNYPNIFWVFRPHPLLKAQLEFNLGVEQAEHIYHLFNSLDNCQLYEGEDIIDLFKYSDGLILDSISFLAEYMPTEKPIIFLNKAENNVFNSIGEAVFEGVYKLEEISSLQQMVEQLILNPKQDYLLNKRKEIVDNLLMKNKKTTAASRIYEHVIENI